MRKRHRRIAAISLMVGFATAPLAGSEPDSTILGAAPTYGPRSVSEVANAAAIRQRLWVPGLDAGYDPQGLTLADGMLFVSAYQSDRVFQDKGSCRVFRVDPGSGRETGHVDLPPPCGHAGGAAYADTRTLYVADTHTLFSMSLDPGMPTIRRFPLGPGMTGGLATAGPHSVWIGTYDKHGPGRIYRFDSTALAGLKDGETLTREMADLAFDIPSYAQGAALDPDDKRLWIARSDFDWGTLDVIDAATGAPLDRFPAPAGLEGIAFGAGGHLWAVSEAGSRHVYSFPFASLVQPFYPLIFEIDPQALRHEK